MRPSEGEKSGVFVVEILQFVQMKLFEASYN